MKYYYKITISYQGSHYLGFQIQAGLQREQTIQGQLNKAIAKITQSKDIYTLASGRTDAGVHAIAQVVKITMPLLLHPGELKAGMNSLLPPDIEVKEVELSDRGFHPIRDVVSKEYWYLFSFAEKKNPFFKQFLGLFPYVLDIEKMQEACSVLVGEHDFRNFHCTGSKVSSTVREVLRAEIVQDDFMSGKIGVLLPKEVYCFRVVGKGFLRQMVRLMMGALLEIGRGKCLVADLKEHIHSKKDFKLGPTAPPQGLYLTEVLF